MGSKVPGAVVTDPPTAKLPCSWIISGSDLLFRVSCAFAEVKRNAAISGSAMIDFRRFLLMKFPHCPSRRVTPGCSFHDPVFAWLSLAVAFRDSFLLENFLSNVDGVKMTNRGRPRLRAALEAE